MNQTIFEDFIHSGWLDANGRTIARLQRVLDTSIIGLMFYFYQPDAIWTAKYISIPSMYIIVVITAVLLPKAGIYKSYRHRTINRLIQRLNSTWISVICFVVLIMFLNKSSSDYSRIAIVLWAITSWIWLFSMHVLTRMYLRNIRRIGRNSRTILYWGEPKAIANFSKQLLDNQWFGYRIVAWFSPVNVENYKLPDYLPKCSGGLHELKEWLDRNDANCIVFSSTQDANKNKSDYDLFSLFGNTCSRVLYAPDWYIDSMQFKNESIGEQNCIEIWGGKQAYDERLAKRLFDLIISLTGIIIILPLLVTISILVKLTSKGPIIFKQKRCGIDGKPFDCYKFRSMYVESSNNADMLKQASKDDPRVTYIGKFLRKWSLDELPQLWNVIRGDMSLVGPRPHALEHDGIYRKLITGYSQRHVFKPGMTGLAQVNGYRGETKEISAMEKRIQADLEYQREWSLLVDIEILCRTIMVLNSSKAY